MDGVSAKVRARIGRHEVIDLRKPPGDVFRQHDVHTAAARYGKNVLLATPGELRISMRATDEEFHKGNEVIKAPQIQPRPKQPGIPTAMEVGAADSAREAVLCELGDEA